jgi:hypothetical protein
LLTVLAGGAGDEVGLVGLALLRALVGGLLQFGEARASSGLRGLDLRIELLRRGAGGRPHLRLQRGKLGLHRRREFRRRRTAGCTHQSSGRTTEARERVGRVVVRVAGAAEPRARISADAGRPRRAPALVLLLTQQLLVARLIGSRERTRRRLAGDGLVGALRERLLKLLHLGLLCRREVLRAERVEPHDLCGGAGDRLVLVPRGLRARGLLRSDRVVEAGRLHGGLLHRLRVRLVVVILLLGEVELLLRRVARVGGSLRLRLLLRVGRVHRTDGADDTRCCTYPSCWHITFLGNGPIGWPRATSRDRIRCR